MARGKNTCRILKEIRRQIAEANDIAYVVEECKFKGDCLGTCPKCEAEVRYLESQLRQRQMLGKAVVVAGLSLSTLTANAQTSTTAISEDTVKVEQSKVVLNGKYKISGTVFSSDDQEAVIGATISLSNDSTAGKNETISNLDGKFTIATDKLPQTLRVSYLGYFVKEIQVTEENYNTPLTIILEEDESLMLEGDLIVAGAIVKKKSWIPKFLRKKKKNK